MVGRSYETVRWDGFLFLATMLSMVSAAGGRGIVGVRLLTGFGQGEGHDGAGDAEDGEDEDDEAWADGVGEQAEGAAEEQDEAHEGVADGDKAGPVVGVGMIDEVGLAADADAGVGEADEEEEAAEQPEGAGSCRGRCRRARR